MREDGCGGERERGRKGEARSGRGWVWEGGIERMRCVLGQGEGGEQGEGGREERVGEVMYVGGGEW